MASHPDQKTIEMLYANASRINSPEFIPKDPVQFPRRFGALRDVEIVSLVSAIMAWGKREMICRDIERFLQLTDYQPFDFMMERAYEKLPDSMNLHRTLFARDLKHLMRGLREIYSRHGSLDAFCAQCGAAKSEHPSWRLAEEMQKICADANGGEECSRCLPTNFRTTALKRVNMALRWLVRDDGIVDMGLWKSLKPSQLYIPLDVHVGNVSRSVGLLDRRQNDRKAVEELTGVLRMVNPDDPVLFDFALFGIGVEQNRPPKTE